MRNPNAQHKKTLLVGAAVAAALAAGALGLAGCGSSNVEPHMHDATEAAELLGGRGFDGQSAEACYDDAGKYFDPVKISDGIEGNHPYYTLYYTDSTGDVWVVYDMGGRMMARVFGEYNWVTETDCITDYDSLANEFYEATEEQAGQTFKNIRKVTPKALDKYGE